MQVLGSGTITTTTAPLVFVEYNYIVPTLHNTTTLYRHFTAAGSWKWYDHDHDGPLVFVEYNYIVPTPYSCRFLGVVRSRTRRPPRVCRKQLHCIDTLQLHALGNGTITATTGPLVFVEYNYIVPTPYSCRFSGMVRSRPRRSASCL